MIATSVLRITDNVLSDPIGYRDFALTRTFKTFDFPHCTFHGIAPMVTIQEEVSAWLMPWTVTFFRKSPVGQVEPHFIHTDIDMGDWSALLYLNPNPPAGDGTDFWTHKETGEIESITPHLRSKEGLDPSKWELREHVKAKFNRLLIFPSSYYHSRAIFDNWGQGDEARLVQVVFGKGKL